MLKHYPYNSLGQANHGWLKAKHHFSFAHYYNPARTGFGKLLVVNDDWVEAGMGFPPHPHRNMEIISFIRSGAITHQDSSGNKGITAAGEVQVMSAGSGIVHSEYNRSKDPLTLYQIWIETNKQNVKPRWESQKFPTQQQESLTLLVSGYNEDKSKRETKPLFINQEARIYGGRLALGAMIEHHIHHQAYILASSGMFDILELSDGNMEKTSMNKGDGAEVTQAKSIFINATTDCEIIIIDTID
ncbi:MULTISPECIES: pirin-like bicupin family protein [unclassified Shewanella]|uniref:pirin family protein n=1 Tax=unclassified Shewanella TaxID=196818 RepID=UPI001BB9960C|nr:MULTISPECIES: pirin-like bicupin family protein [unclassified Shewanella]GIU07620.1 putative quercetin 2,3-dioxygenase [Shewanella sp. MBTL60-112-B1]GIU30219.1 putative quercetin 2,3-dioxygenase [Shewanella sp. MBTL60-112-B2]